MMGPHPVPRDGARGDDPVSRSGALLSFPAQDPPAGDDVRHLAGDHRAPGDLGRGLASFYAVPLKFG